MRAKVVVSFGSAPSLFDAWTWRGSGRFEQELDGNVTTITDD